MCICLLMLLEHAKFVPQRSILCQHSVILCGSSDGGTEHAVGLQKIAAPEPREQVVKVLSKDPKTSDINWGFLTRDHPTS
jgi:hypothetical protein